MDPQPPAPTRAAPSLLGSALAFYGIVTLFAVGYALFSGDVRTLLGERACEPKELAAALGFALALAGLVRVGAKAWKPLGRAAQVGGDLLGPLPVRHALALACLSGMAEELLFRGALWPALKLGGASLLGGLVHVVPRRALWLYPFYAAAVGLVMGLLRQGSESVVPPMLAHVVLDAVTLLWLVRRPGAAVPPPAAAPPAPPGAADPLPRADAGPSA